MITVSEAYGLIQKHLFKPIDMTVALDQAVGKVLAEPVHADRDFPPFDRVAMDGIAVSFERIHQGQREFIVEGIQPAGGLQKQLTHPGNCMEVMTGAVLPSGTDTVIKYEEIELREGKATLLATSFQPGQNVHRQGQDARGGQQLLAPGIILSPAEIALLASVGKERVVAKSLPSIAIVSTGDELVEINATPAPHQVRRSNSYALQASLAQLGCTASMHHMPDHAEIIEDNLKSLIETVDVVILSGGVSKGKYDYIPKAMESLGIQKIFHQVSQRPGKPFWFGAGRRRVVFALPGNPVSTYLCFYKYIKPWLMESLGVKTKTLTAVLGERVIFQPKMTYYLQVALKIEEGRCVAYPVPGGGSGDFANLKDVDGFIELPLERNEFQKGEVFTYIPFRPL